jgi:hypothetical protein
MPVNLVAFLALVLTSLALIPSGAHLFALPNTLGLAPDACLVAQPIDRGRAMFGLVSIPAVAVSATLAITLRRERPAGPFVAAAAVLRATSLAVVFVFVDPGTSRPRAGPCCRRTGRRCGPHGNTATQPVPR